MYLGNIKAKSAETKVSKREIKHNFARGLFERYRKMQSG